MESRSRAGLAWLLPASEWQRLVPLFSEQARDVEGRN